MTKIVGKETGNGPNFEGDDYLRAQGVNNWLRKAKKIFDRRAALQTQTMT